MQRLAEAGTQTSTWRAIVVVGSTALTVTAAAAVAHVVAAPDEWILATGRGLLIAATAAASLLGSAWAMRRGLVAAGIPADEPLVPPQAPEALRTAGRRVGRSPRLTAAAALVVGLVLGLLGGRLGGPGGGGIFDRETIELASGTDEAEEAARGERVAGARIEAADGTGGGDESDGAASGGDGPGGGSVSGGSGGGEDGGGKGGGKGGGGTGPGGTTTTTQPKPKTPYVCDALDDYDGDVEDLLAAVGLDDTSEMTKQACRDIKDILSNPVDEIEDIIDDLVGKLPVTTTTITVPITLPPVTTTTVTLPPVTTTTVTLPPLTVPSLPLL